MNNREILYEELVKLSSNVSMLTQRLGSDITLRETANLYGHIRKMMLIIEPEEKKEKK